MSSRIAARFADLKSQKRAAFAPFIMAGDPDYDASLALMRALPGAGADLIELGAAFSDPMADGPVIQAAGQRALQAGQSLRKTLNMAATFRQENDETPIVLMGYYNPIYAYGVPQFLADAEKAGVDGFIVVDLPPEEDAELCVPARAAGLDFIRLATPTTDEDRFPAIIKNTSGFVYYVSVAGVTGQKTGDDAAVCAAVKALRDRADLPVAVGFGVKTPEKAAAVARYADAVVVGSALIEKLAAGLEGGGATPDNRTKEAAINGVLNLARDLGEAVRAAR